MNRNLGKLSRGRVGRLIARFVSIVAAVFLGGTALPVTASAQTSAGAVSPAPSTISSPQEADASYANYKFRSGEILPNLRLHYSTLGTPHRNAQGDIDNAVLLLHWTNANGSALLSLGFVKALYEPGRPLDVTRYYLIFPDNVGHGRSSKPSDGLRAAFPNYGYNDIVDLQHKLVTETLGIKRLHAIVGVSMGGMNAWQWAEAYPDAMNGIMPIVSFPSRVSGRNLVWRRMAVRAIQSDPDWKQGNYTQQPRGLIDGYSMLRLMIDGVPRLQAAIPDDAAADKFVDSVRKQAETLDANDVLYTIKSSLDYDPEPDLGKIKTEVYALNFDDDEFNPAQLKILERLITRVPNAKFAIQHGSEKSWGHLTMAFPMLWADQVEIFMRQISDKRPPATKSH